MNPNAKKLKPEATTAERSAYMRSLVVGNADQEAIEKKLGAIKARLEVYCNGARIILADGRKETAIGVDVLAPLAEKMLELAKVAPNGEGHQ